MSVTVCVPCKFPEWRAYWGRDRYYWYIGVTLGRFHVEVVGK